MLATRNPRWHALVGATVVALAACGADPCTADFPSVSGSVLRVSAACGGPGGDGSAEAPFATIAAAGAVASPGQTIVVAAGTYAETVSLPVGVGIAGAGADKVVIRPSSGARGIAVPAGTTPVRIAGLHVEGATGLGIGAEGVALTLEQVRVTGTLVDPGDPKGGHGIAVSRAATLRLVACEVSGNRGVGLVATKVGAVSIIDPYFSGSPRSTEAGAAGIIDPYFAPASKVSANKAGGIAIIDPYFSPGGKSDDPKSAFTIVGTDIADNAVYGLAVYGGGGTLTRTAVRGTVAASSSDVADGVIVASGTVAGAAPAEATVAFGKDVVIADNGRAGVLVAARADVRVGASLSGNGFGGLWAQGTGSAVHVLSSARVITNALVGLAVTNGARLQVTGARVEDTRMYPYGALGTGLPTRIGDGVGVFANSRAAIDGCLFAGNKRAAIVGHDTGVDDKGRIALTVTGSTFSAGAYGIVINAGSKGTVSADELKKSNTFAADVGKAVDPAGKLTVRVSLCGEDKPATAECLP